MEGMNRVG